MQAYGPYSASATGMFQVLLLWVGPTGSSGGNGMSRDFLAGVRSSLSALTNLISVHIITGCDHVCDSSDHLDAYSLDSNAQVCYTSYVAHFWFAVTS